ncbi:MAG: hypothetical protein WCS65_09725 [Verrucomicrobiae bacterium]
MSEPKLYITFKTFSRKPAEPAQDNSVLAPPTYSLSMLRSALLLNGLCQLIPSSVGFREFARQSIDGRKVSPDGIFSSLINQILEFYYFDRNILLISPGLTRAGDQEYWFDKVIDPATKQAVIFLKTSNVDSSEEILQLAYLDPALGNIKSIYQLLRSLRLPQINLQEIVDSIASSQDLVSSLTAFVQKLIIHPKEEMGVMEVFLLLGQEKFKEWGLREIVVHSQDMVPPQAERFHYPPFHFPSIPGIETPNGPGLVEAIYILGFLGLSDDIPNASSSKHLKQ